MKVERGVRWRGQDRKRKRVDKTMIERGRELR